MIHLARFPAWALIPLLANAQRMGPPQLPSRIEAALKETPTAARANWGIQTVRLSNGRPLYQRNADRHFTPASNAKVYAAAVALLRLGPDYRFVTELGVDGPVLDGVLQGDLRLVGGGDPSLSGRAYPYQPGPPPGEPLAALESFADSIAKAGIRQIEGSVVADDRRWPWVPYPDGWSIDDAVWEYGAPVSALAINDNALRLRVLPGEPGSPARIEWHPRLEYYWVDNQVRTEPGPRLFEVFRAPGSRQIRLRGRIAPDGGGRQELLAIEDPAHFAAFALHEALTRRGVRIKGGPQARHRAAGEGPVDDPLRQVLVRRESPPLSEILAVINKASQNLHTEMVTREVGLKFGGDGTTENGLAELKKLLLELGAQEDDFDLHDGSGLSRLNLITPATSVRLLRHLWDSPHREAWLATLPVGGRDGTLQNRFQFPKRKGSRWPSPETVRGKTGTLSHVATLTGYIQSKTWGTVAFSIMANNYNGPGVDIRNAIDKICLEIAK